MAALKSDPATRQGNRQFNRRARLKVLRPLSLVDLLLWPASPLSWRHSPRLNPRHFIRGQMGAHDPREAGEMRLGRDRGTLLSGRRANGVHFIFIFFLTSEMKALIHEWGDFIGLAFAVFYPPLSREHFRGRITAAASTVKCSRPVDTLTQIHCYYWTKFICWGNLGRLVLVTMISQIAERPK